MTQLTAGAVDRREAERDDPDLLRGARADPASLVLVIHRGAAPLRDGRSLLFHAADAVPDGATWGFLGRGEGGAAVLVAAFDDDAAAPVAAPGGWGEPRTAGPLLTEQDAATLLAARSLAGWFRDAFCPACGSRTELRQAGWSRRCLGCGREIFPRTDPAVIVTVSSADGARLLLGANAMWRGRMFSCFAGFVEAGESLEHAVHREIREEAGVRLRDLRFAGSQPWPYPRSLMVGFHATAVDDAEALADGEEILRVRWFDRDEAAACLRGEGDVDFPGAASIAHRLIAAWCDAP